ncbi:hypothetical protein J1N10_20415, partial [Carboxylicivirga sp. A043]|uniref:hypothetical protein n=1 Tax=Carboxylicivirga litoralis TaxID=2816963 RepID=UPI0021CB57CE
LALKEYKMSLSESKNGLYEKPIITELSIAKQKISDLFNEHLILKNKDEDKEESKNENLYFSSSNVITRFKSIITECGIQYKDIMNYALAVLDKKTSKLTSKYLNLENKPDIKVEKQFEKGFLEILDVAFFLYSVSPRVNSTIKICLIVEKIVTFLKKNKKNNYLEPFSFSSKHNLYKKISDEINHILKKNKLQSETPIETLYLLIALSQLGREYRLSLSVLCDFLNIRKENGVYKLPDKLNYFTITVILFYIKDIKAYIPIKELIKKQIIYWFEKLEDKYWNKDTESLLLLLDVLACPYLNEKVPPYRLNKIKEAKAQNKKKKNINRYIKQAKDIKYSFKKNVLDLVHIKTNQIQLIEAEKFWFTKWIEFDFGMELQSKRSQDVY